MKTRSYSTVAELAAEVGSLIPCAGNLPLDLSAPQFVWYIEQGAVDLFIEERSEIGTYAAPQHLLHAEAGRLVPSVEPNTENTTLSVTAKGLPGTMLRQIPIDRLNDLDHQALADQIDAWVKDVSTMLSRYDSGATRADTQVSQGQSQTVGAGVISTGREVAWITGMTPGTCLYLGLLDASDGLVGGDSELILPLVRDTWARITEPQELTIQSSRTLADSGRLLPALAQFHSSALSLERLNRTLAVVDRVNLERSRISKRQTDETGARHDLYDLYGVSDDEGADASDTALADTLRAIGEHEDIEFKIPSRGDSAEFSEHLFGILDASGVRARRVNLRDDEKWWLNSSGAMLAFRKDDDRPVALLPGWLGHYHEVCPAENQKIRINSAHAKSLSSEAWLFYRPLNSESTNFDDMLRLACRGLSGYFARFLVTGFIGGLITLLPALILGFIVDEAIPNGETNLLYTAGAALCVIAVLGAALHVLQGMALMRLEGHATSRAEAALWDRLLRLPPSFLQGYSAGDLTMRGMTFQALRDVVQSALANGVLAVVFLLPAFLIVFLYDAMLGTIAVSFGLLSLIITVILGWRQIAPYSRMRLAMQNLTGRLFQLINGISILRLEGAEGSAFAVWARGYRSQKVAEMKYQSIDQHVQAMSAAIPFLAGAVILAAVALPDREPLSIGDFLVVYTVFMVYQGAVARLGASFSGIASMLSAGDQIRPFLDESPEVSTEGELVEVLTGDIRLDHVSFRYEDNSPLILDDVSIQIRPGEFVAITGESGAGKSTLFKLLLGALKPTNGAVYYDKRDLRHLNIKQVRRKIGVIPQDIQLQPDDIWDNIVGGRENVTGQDAWDAARLAAIDREIMAMPMKMMTSVGAGIGVTSGGESQRILIAQALVENPRILLLDEPTNWLENESQAKIMDNLAQLGATRVVIAHRLSTLQHVDRVYVLQKGSIVEQGSFSELMEIDGVFRGLVNRQLS